MKREALVQGVLLIVLLAVLFPRVFFSGEYAVASSLMGAWAPWDAVFGDEMRPYQNPLTIETVMAFNADFTLAKSQLASGEWPLWNPLQFAGKPLLANYQSTVFYPPRLLHAALPIPLATTLYVLLKLWLCGMMAYGYGRVIGLGVAASRFLSVAWMLSGYTFTWSYWTPTDVAAWLPLLLMGVEWLLAGSRRRGFSALFVGAVLMLLAGHPESAFVNGLGVGLYFLLRLAVMRARASAVIGGGVLALAGWGIALLICAVQIIPFAEYAANSNNVAFREGTTAARHAVPLGEWVSFFVPRYFGTNAEENFRGEYNSTFNSMMYPGIVVWVGALLLIGAWRAADRRRVMCWFAVSTLAGVMAFDIPVVQTLLALPVLSSLWQCYFVGFALFGLAVLSALGVDAWTKKKQNLKGLYPVVGAVGLLALLMLPKVAFDLGAVSPDGQTGYFNRQIGMAALMTGLCLLVLYAGIRRRTPSHVPVAFALLLVVDLGVAGRGLLPSTPRDQHYPPTEITDRLQALPIGSRIDVVSETDIRPGLITPYGVEEHWGYDGILPARIIALNAFVGSPEKTGVLSGVTHRLIKGERESEDLPVELDYVENDGALPRAYTVYDWEVVDDSTATFDRLRSEGFDPRRTALLESAVGIEPDRGNVPVITAAELVSRTSTHVVVRAGAERPGVLVLLDAYYPGWTATVDGNPARIVPVNHAFRGVAVPAGEHEVVFAYQPRSFDLGLIVSTVTLVVVFAVGVFLLGLRRVWFAR